MFRIAAALAALCLVLASCGNIFIRLAAGGKESFVVARESRVVSFDRNGGDTEPDPKTITVKPPSQTTGVLPQEPERAGYTFGGWNRARNGSGAVFTAATVVEADCTVYAQWQPEEAP